MAKWQVSAVDAWEIRRRHDGPDYVRPVRFLAACEPEGPVLGDIIWPALMSRSATAILTISATQKTIS